MAGEGLYRSQQHQSQSRRLLKRLCRVAGFGGSLVCMRWRGSDRIIFCHLQVGKDLFWYQYIKELDRQRARGVTAVTHAAFSSHPLSFFSTPPPPSLVLTHPLPCLHTPCVTTDTLFALQQGSALTNFFACLPPAHDSVGWQGLVLVPVHQGA